MARKMPSLEAEFRERVSTAIRLAEIGEIAKAEAPAGSQTRRNFHYTKIELLYEMAYLRIFVSWEAFLEQAFLRYLCGYTSKIGMAVPVAGQSFATTLASAEAAVLGGRAYRLWHSPSEVVTRASKFFGSSPIQTVVSSNTARLEQFAAVRHRITHSQTDARNKFNAATMTIAGKRYMGARAGAFLRDIDPNTTSSLRWVELLGMELQNLAAQIA
jgi:hypothetical protein